jgi:hypothetical protein
MHPLTFCGLQFYVEITRQYRAIIYLFIYFLILFYIASPRYSPFPPSFWHDDALFQVMVETSL